MANAFSKNIFLSTLFIVIVISILAFSIMLVYENYQRGKIFEDYLQLEQQIVLDDVYSQYMQNIYDTNVYCTVLQKQIANQFEISSELLKNMKSANNTGILSSDNKVKYTYILTNIKLWLHYQDLKKTCNIEKPIAIYFYPETVNMSGIKAAELDAKTQAFEYELKTIQAKTDLGVLALPYQESIPILAQVILDYNIVNAPSIIYNEKVYYDLNALNKG